MTEPRSTEDGVTHINVSRRGNTALGRALSMSYPAEVTHPVLGAFKSLKVLHCWMKYKYHPINIRELSLDEFDKYFEDNLDKFKRRARKVNGFVEIYEEVLYYRIVQDPEVLAWVKQNDLPFAQYTNSGDKYTANWLVPVLENVTKRIKSEQPVYPSVYVARLITQMSNE